MTLWFSGQRTKKKNESATRSGGDRHKRRDTADGERFSQRRDSNRAVGKDLPESEKTHQKLVRDRGVLRKIQRLKRWGRKPEIDIHADSLRSFFFFFRDVVAKSHTSLLTKNIYLTFWFLSLWDCLGHALTQLVEKANSTKGSDDRATGNA